MSKEKVLENKNGHESGHFSVGFAPMDAIHDEFFDLCVALENAPDDQKLSVLDDLLAHTLAHFNQENTWMHKHRYTAISCHVREHEEVLSVINDVRNHVAAGDIEIATRLAQELPAWLAHHVKTMDGMLGEFLSAVAG